VRLRDVYPSGAVVEYSRHFWRKRDALKWIESSGLDSEI
jgi:hypothetical protein